MYLCIYWGAIRAYKVAREKSAIFTEKRSALCGAYPSQGCSCGCIWIIQSIGMWGGQMWGGLEVIISLLRLATQDGCLARANTSRMRDIF